MKNQREPNSRYLRKYHWDNRPPEEKTIKPVSLPIHNVTTHSMVIEITVEWRKIVWVVRALLDMCPKQ